MLYMLGALVMDTKPFPLDEMAREIKATVVSKPVMGTLPVGEFMGALSDEITLTGRLLPTKIGGLNELSIADEMCRTGTKFPVQRGDGVRPGWYAITSISEKHQDILRDGVGFVVAYTIKMKKVQSDKGQGQQVIGALLSMFEVFG